jgi:hypothetical protein
MQPSSTNKPCGLTKLLYLQQMVKRFCENRKNVKLNNEILGDHSRGVTPDPIPNSEVKPSYADGTAWETVWESRSLPGFILSLMSKTWGFFFIRMSRINVISRMHVSLALFF